METSIELCEENEIPALEAFLVERIYEFNARATGYFDGRLLGGRLRDDSGEVIGAFTGHTWGGCCVITHLWVHESRWRQGLGRALLQAAETEAARRGCELAVLSTHDFQAPAFYARLGYVQVGYVDDTPAGYGELILQKRLAD